MQLSKLFLDLTFPLKKVPYYERAKPQCSSKVQEKVLINASQKLQICCIGTWVSHPP